MNIRLIVLILMAIALSACRGNIPRPDESTGRAGAENATPAATSSDNKSNKNNVLKESNPSSSASGSYLAGDGPGADTPADLANIPDAAPRDEPLHRYANRPYTVLGKNYTPLTQTGTYKERGVASWYGKKFHGQKTSIGEVYDMYGMTAAHTTLPIPSYARVTNLANHKSVIVRINDRGPFLHDRIIDLSYTAASKLGIIGSGQGMVEVESLNADSNSSAAISPIYREPVQITPLPSEAPVSAEGKVYLQLGAFNSQRGAEEFLASMRAKLGDTGKTLSLSQKNGLFKVRIGTYSSADTARATALKLEERLGFKPVVSQY
jgi:rare lipoprotein A